MKKQNKKEIFIVVIIYIFIFHITKCKHNSLNIEMEVLMWLENGHVFSCSMLNPVLIWNCSIIMAARTLAPTKISIQFKLRYKIAIANHLFKQVFIHFYSNFMLYCKYASLIVSYHFWTLSLSQLFVNLNKKCCTSKTYFSKKEVNLVIIWGFLYFAFWEETFGALDFTLYLHFIITTCK